MYHVEANHIRNLKGKAQGSQQFKSKFIEKGNRSLTNTETEK